MHLDHGAGSNADAGAGATMDGCGEREGVGREWRRGWRRTGVQRMGEDGAHGPSSGLPPSIFIPILRLHPPLRPSARAQASSPAPAAQEKRAGRGPERGRGRAPSGEREGRAEPQPHLHRWCLVSSSSSESDLVRGQFAAISRPFFVKRQSQGPSLVALALVGSTRWPLPLRRLFLRALALALARRRRRR